MPLTSEDSEDAYVSNSENDADSGIDTSILSKQHEISFSSELVNQKDDLYDADFHEEDDQNVKNYVPPDISFSDSKEERKAINNVLKFYAPHEVQGSLPSSSNSDDLLKTNSNVSDGLQLNTGFHLSLSTDFHDNLSNIENTNKDIFVIGSDKDISNKSVLESDEENSIKRQLQTKLETMQIKQKDSHKKHYCKYCGKPSDKLPRHMERKHSDIDDVIEALSYPVRSKLRKAKWSEIIRSGDFEINIQALKYNLKPTSVRSTKTERELLPCDFCKGFFEGRKLFLHIKKCSMKPEILKTTGDRNYMKSARVMLASNLFEGQFAEVKKQIVTKIGRRIIFSL